MRSIVFILFFLVSNGLGGTAEDLTGDLGKGEVHGMGMMCIYSAK